MSKFLVIGGYEFRRMRRDRGFLALLLLLLALSSYAIWNGIEWTDKRHAAIDLIKAEERDRRAFGRRFVESQLVIPATLAVLPPTEMSGISIGQADAYPFHAEIYPLHDYSTLFKRVWGDIGSPDVRAAGRFDLAFVIVLLLPLVLLATTYDLWSKERERGIAALVVSQPIAISPLIWVRAVTRGVLILGPFIAWIVSASIWMGARDLANLVALACIVFIYGAFWIAIAVLINCITRRSAEAAIAAGAAWLLIVVMAPSLTLAAVDVIRPAPSAMGFATALKARKAAVSKQLQETAETITIKVRESSPTIPDRLRERYGERVALDEALWPLISAHKQAERTRRDLLDTIRFFLPAVAIQDALDRVAGSDADRAIVFEQQVRATQMALRQRYKTHLDNDTLLTLAEYDREPGFQFKESDKVFETRLVLDLLTALIATILIVVAVFSLRKKLATP
ncbi:DUF3526 domain-containing protein [Microbulbifer elongatus]|uniref:DUF3526 domain-containing protein n=1 Tax=Microbulbifer elongatus TaxID=86173 RepID=UPI001E4007D2|nr:DUF3526 domain-containing protein [Microbulbifer elongatus]